MDTEIDKLTLPQDEVFVVVSSFLPPSAASSSARPQLQFLQAFLTPVVPQTRTRSIFVLFWTL